MKHLLLCSLAIFSTANGMEKASDPNKVFWQGVEDDLNSLVSETNNFLSQAGTLIGNFLAATKNEPIDSPQHVSAKVQPKPSEAQTILSQAYEQKSIDVILWCLSDKINGTITDELSQKLHVLLTALKEKQLADLLKTQQACEKVQPTAAIPNTFTES